MAHELVALFSRITTDDHESLVNLFSQVMGADHVTATFFLDASNWHVETALNAFLTVGSQQHAYFLLCVKGNVSISNNGGL